MGLNDYIRKELSASGHGAVAVMIGREDARQDETIELIASENFPSDAVRIAAASSPVAKYAEGYPDTERTGNRGRYYGGCENVDMLESYCCKKWQEAFNTNYHVNVQPHSGSQANMAAYAAVLQPGDTILSMDLNHGGHLTHGSWANFSGKLYNIHHYYPDDSGYLNYDVLALHILHEHPKLILAGASAYPREIDFQKIRYAIDAAMHKDCTYNPYFMVDMAHIAGLVVAGDHQSPFGLADIITTTTHKTLRGTRGGLIFCKPELAKRIDSAVFPGCQGGPLEHIIAAKAVTADEACAPEFKEYIHNVVKNTKAMCNEFINMGYDVVTGGTDNHMFLIDFSRTHPDLTGADVQKALDDCGITVNKNCVPGEKRNPTQTSGIRVGCAAMTTKGYTTERFINVAHMMDKIIRGLK